MNTESGESVHLWRVGVVTGGDTWQSLGRVASSTSCPSWWFQGMHLVNHPLSGAFVLCGSLKTLISIQPGKNPNNCKDGFLGWNRISFSEAVEDKSISSS